MNHKLVRAAAAVQIALGTLLLAGTVTVAHVSYPVVREGSNRASKGFSSAAGAIGLLKGEYVRSAEGVFALTNSMDRVATTVARASASADGIGGMFIEYGDAEGTLAKVRPFKGSARDFGGKISAASRDMQAAAEAMQEQSAAIKKYSRDEHRAIVEAMVRCISLLEGAAAVLGRPYLAGIWCAFVCALGLCVSLLLVANGALLFASSKAGKY